MDSQAQFDSFRAYLEDSKGFPSEQKKEIEARIEVFQPYQSAYLPMVFPGGLAWFYPEDRIVCARIMKDLFRGGGLKATLNKPAGGKWKTLTILTPDYFVLDLCYSLKNNIDLKSQLFIGKVIDQSENCEHSVNILNEIKDKLNCLPVYRDSNIINNCISDIYVSIDKLITIFYDERMVIKKSFRRAIITEHKNNNIIKHLIEVFYHYVPSIKKEVLCKRIEELYTMFYPSESYNFAAIKKTLQRLRSPLKPF
jgi:hypothetical protein